LPTASFGMAICDLCALEHNYTEMVDAAVEARWPGFRMAGPGHPAWELRTSLLSRHEVRCLTVSDYEGMEVVSLCPTHLRELAEEADCG